MVVAFFLVRLVSFKNLATGIMWENMHVIGSFALTDILMNFFNKIPRKILLIYSINLLKSLEGFFTQRN